MPAAKQPRVDIIDIRADASQRSLGDELAAAARDGLKRLPTLLLYDDRGLQLFEDITYLDEYYLTNAEIALLTEAADALAARIPPGTMVVELGSGNLRKVCLLLAALDARATPVDYFALDLSRRELERTLARVPAFAHIACHGLLGTYDDGRAWLSRPEAAARPKIVLHLGSSIGNFGRDEAVDFLGAFADLLRPGDAMLAGLDACADPHKIYRAYNDSKGVTHQFILNGLSHVNRIFGRPVFRLAYWRVVGEYVFDAAAGRHQAFVVPVRSTPVLGAVLGPGDRVPIEESLKYAPAEADRLWARAVLRPAAAWLRAGEYGLHLLERASLPFGRAPAAYAAAPLPALHDWRAVWHAWDTVAMRMLPPSLLADKPIRLRNACVFYLGHIPTFLDLQLSRAAGEPPTEPANYAAIFERGIDPDVDNPDQCHAHSAIPDQWPPVAR